MAFDLRPLSLGELLDRSFSLYRRNFWLFVGIMALPSLIALGFGVIVAVFNPQPVNPESVAAGETQPAEILGAVAWFVAAVFGMLIVYFVTYAVALGATTVAVSELYMGRAITIRGAYAPLRGKVGRLALLLVLLAVRMFGVVILGFLAVGVATAMSAAGSPILAVLVMLTGGIGVFALWVWVILRYAVTVPAAVLEDETATAAIQRSIDLTRGSLLRVFVLLLFTMIITYAVLAIFQGPFLVAAVMAGPETSGGFWFNLLGTITGSIGGAFTAPLMIVAFAVLYYDLRVRREGLDLQVMMANLDAGTSVAAPTS
ncbi:MAG TPA: glycerophosphoryl diester phosphodiesterase membrane domain-containing protein [Vicinamibacterales bacterium]|nr:glycerophosphoryl diester phosphodiesterase membrane domain-containing protein [Vicinamibacterales bacterium]